MEEQSDKPDYKLTKNQQRFIKEAKKAGMEISYTYSGRRMFGRQCPSVVVDDLLDGIREFSKETKVATDNMGKQFVLYAEV